MFRIASTVVASVLVVVLVGLVPVLSQDGDAEEEKWAKLRAPGEQHKWLAQDVGDWTLTGKMWLGPDQTIPLKGKSAVKMVFDRYAQEDYTLGEGPMQYKGLGFVGYDNLNEQFQALYTGTSGTGMHVLTGQLNADKTVLTLTGQRPQKVLGGVVHKEKVVITRKSSDETLVQMYEASGEEEMHQTIELTYKRKK